MSSKRPPAWLAWLRAIGFVLALNVVAAGAADAQPAGAWSQLTPSQREALAPLQQDWDHMDAERRNKWIALSDRYHQLKPDQQARVQERMRAWASLTPQDRQAARRNFKQSQQWTPEQRQRAWDEYSKLPPDDREKLQQQAGKQGARTGKPARPQPPPSR